MEPEKQLTILLPGHLSKRIISYLAWGQSRWFEFQSAMSLSERFKFIFIQTTSSLSFYSTFTVIMESFPYPGINELWPMGCLFFLGPPSLECWCYCFTFLNCCFKKRKENYAAETICGLWSIKYVLSDSYRNKLLTFGNTLGIENDISKSVMVNI